MGLILRSMNKKVEKFLKVVLLVALFLSVGIFNSVKADNTTPTVETVTASSATMVYGSAVPTITAIYSPSLTTPLATADTCSTVATSTSPVGAYASTCSGASDPNYTFNSYTNGSVSITQATPTITWSNPADIISGTALSATQLNATASVSGTSVPGTFAYTPDVGTILSAGTNQTLSVTFTPTDTIDYTTVTATTAINVTAPQGSGSGSSTPAPTLDIETSVDVPVSCSATDTDGVAHNYLQDGSTNSYLAICALEAAIKSGSISNVQLSNKYPTMGLFITSINGVTADPSQYWAIYQNGSYANSGIAELPVATRDSIVFQLEDFSGNNFGDKVTLNIRSLISNTSSVGTSGGGYVEKVNTTIISPTKSVFDLNKALSFLSAQQKNDGSFGEDLYTDWAAVAMASNNSQSQVVKLVSYLETDKIESSTLTDSERHAMALMSLGLNPYNADGENYISNITASFDGKQFGDPKEDNDDIFALIVLQNTGYSQNDQLISKDISFVLSAQNADGSWDSSVDMTGAAMEALSSFNQNEQIKDALTKAENYLKQNQKSDGSWNDNASSTAWAMEGILAQGEKISDWTTNSTTGTTGNTPLDYLATIQDTDGGVKDSNMQNKIWETAYVTSALSGKTWNQIMQKFEKEETPSPVVAPKVIAKKHVAKKTTPVTNTSEKIINTPKIENQANQNSASAINAISPSPAPTKTSAQTETPKKNWFSRLMDKIFGSH
jgi:hypothetical protein